MANSADPDQLTDLDLHYLQWQCIYVFSRTRVKSRKRNLKMCLIMYTPACPIHTIQLYIIGNMGVQCIHCIDLLPLCLHYILSGNFSTPEPKAHR